MELQQRKGAIQLPNMGPMIPQIDPAVAAMTQRASAQFASLGRSMAVEPDQAPTSDGIKGYGQSQGQGGATPGSSTYVDQIGIVKGLMERGMPQHIAEGFAMNAVDESGLNTGAIGDNGNAGGLWQKNGSRFTSLKNNAASSGRDWTDLGAQLDDVVYDNANGERGAYAKILATKTRQEAAAAIVNYWERPAEEHRARREAAYLASQ